MLSQFKSNASYSIDWPSVVVPIDEHEHKIKQNHLETVDDIKDGSSEVEDSVGKADFNYYCIIALTIVFYLGIVMTIFLVLRISYYRRCMGQRISDVQVIAVQAKS